MNWSSLFLKKRAETKEKNCGQHVSGGVFRFQTVALLIALSLFAYSYVNSVAQEEPTQDAPVVVAGDTPVPVEPAIVAPVPVEPAIVAPVPVEPAIVAPVPVEPALVEPVPVEPAPVEPALVAPVPVEPAPVAPVLVEPAPTDDVAVPALTVPTNGSIPPLDPNAPLFDPSSLGPETRAKLLEAINFASATSEATPGTELEVTASEPVTEEVTKKLWYESPLFSFAVVILVIVASIFLAKVAAKAWQMPDHMTKFTLIIFTLLGSVTATGLGWHRLTLGIDLSGGVVLVYDVTPRASDVSTSTTPDIISNDQFDNLIKAVNSRINPAGVKEIVVQKYGTSQIKIVIPLAEAAEVARIEKIISEAGTLEFRILASRSVAQESDIVARATQQTSATKIYSDAGVLQAMWVPISDKKVNEFNNRNFVLRKNGGRSEVLVIKDKYDVEGNNVRNITETQHRDEQTGVLEPAISFRLDDEGKILFGRLTRDYSPNLANPEATTRNLGIIMSGELHSAPSIRTPITDGNTVITFSKHADDPGNVKLMEEIGDLKQVMEAGALPADISREPISNNQMGPTLGAATIKSGQIAAIIAISSIFIFMLVYYRWCGMIACSAVVANFFLIMAVMLGIRAAFTLSGLAGLVLTLGMAVDANILIFERLREELNGGSTLKMAIRNAFARASSAIIDSNVTTLITAVILYVVGTEQTRGFAVTLFLGVLFSMYTAVFCSHVVFEVAERRRWITKLTMLRILEKPNFNFMALRKATTIVIILLCVASFIAAITRGKSLFDIDFVGGVSVDIVFKEPQKVAEIEKSLTSNEMRKTLPDLTVSVVRSPVSDNSKEDGKETSTLGRHFTIATATPVGSEAQLHMKTVKQSLKDLFDDKLVYDTLTFELTEQSTTDARLQTVAKIKIDPSMNYKSLEQNLTGYISKTVDEKAIPFNVAFAIVNEEASDANKTSKPYPNWVVTFESNKADVEKIMTTFQGEFKSQPWFPASNTIGGVVASYTRYAAIAAILISFVAIVIYLRFRFHNIFFGIASVIALVSNVVITVGAIAISAWLEPVLGFLQVEQFKIGLTVIAALLTIIGYSINDTIILFDRIREVRGKSSRLTIEMINQSTNQTLSRTLLTSLSTLFVILVLYFIGGAGLHTFAFALAVGVAVGTFSSIFIAAPALYWMINQSGKPAARTVSKKEKFEKYNRKPKT